MWCATQSLRRDKPELGFHFGKVFETPIFMQEWHVVFPGNDGDRAIVRTAWCDAGPATAGIRLGRRDVRGCAGPGFQQGQREEMRAQPVEARDITRACYYEPTVQRACRDLALG